MATITKGQQGKVEVGVKRFYLPGVTIHDKCPECGEEMVRDLGSSCIYYPVLNEPTKVSMCCSKEHEWEVPVVITVDIKVL